MKISTDKRNKYWFRLRDRFSLFNFISSHVNLFENFKIIRNNLNLNLCYGNYDSVYQDERELITYEKKILLNTKKKVYELGKLIGEVEFIPYDKTVKSYSDVMISDNSGLEIIGIYKAKEKWLILKDSVLVGLISVPFWGNYIEVSFNEPELLTYMLILGDSFIDYLHSDSM